MPNIRKPQTHWELWISLGPELQKHVERARYPGFELNTALTQLLIRVASKPFILAAPKRHAGDVLAFHRAFVRDTDAVLGCLTFLRKTLNDWRSDQSGFVTLFLRQNAARKSTSQTGKPVPVNTMTAQELADYLTPIAGFPITDDSLKKAWQRIAKADRAHDEGCRRLERAEVQKHFRDGATPGKPKKVKKPRKSTGAK